MNEKSIGGRIKESAKNRRFLPKIAKKTRLRRAHDRACAALDIFGFAARPGNKFENLYDI